MAETPRCPVGQQDVFLSGFLFMESDPKGMGHILRQHRRQCRLVRLPDGLHRAEMLPQLRLPLGAQTGNAVQCGAHGALGMVLVVLGDGETVGLLLDLADE